VEWITPIPCGGRFRAHRDEGSWEYLDRNVVIAKRVSGPTHVLRTYISFQSDRG